MLTGNVYQVQPLRLLLEVVEGEVVVKVSEIKAKP